MSSREFEAVCWATSRAMRDLDDARRESWSDPDRYALAKAAAAPAVDRLVAAFRAEVETLR